MHLDTDSIQRLLHGELTPSHDVAARSHLERCAECRGAVARATSEEDEVFRALRSLDHPAPRPDYRSIRSRGASRRPEWWRLAASVALVLATSGLLYAAPGSPLPGLLRRAATWLDPSPPAAAPGAQTPQTPAPAAGVTVVPTDSFEIVFEAAQSVGVARVTLADSDRLSVRAFGSSVPFDSEVDRLIIRNTGSSSNYEIRLPTSSPLVRLEVGGAVLLTKRGARIYAAAARGTAGDYVITLDPGVE